MTLIDHTMFRPASGAPVPASSSEHPASVAAWETYTAAVRRGEISAELSHEVIELVKAILAAVVPVAARVGAAEQSRYLAARFTEQTTNGTAARLAAAEADELTWRLSRGLVETDGVR